MAKTRKKMKPGPKTMNTRAKNLERTIENSYGDVESYVTSLWNKPATKYVVGGIAVAALVPLTSRLLRAYPAIGEFLRENMDTVDQKLGELGSRIKEGFNEESNTTSRH